mmetsp:Transcript_482/g.1671  ORF Transcript_482/g.1671 Transcript_482/m.1671 type:complete len:474 (-) Transcript_482:191-1612(-)
MEVKRRRVELAEGESEIEPAADARKLVRQMEKSVNKNMQMRAKFAGQPEKFVDSEVDLDMAIQGLRNLAATPHQFPELVELGAVDTLITLLAHENDDICADTINLLNDFFSQDDEAEEEPYILQLAEKFIAVKGPQALVAALPRFKDDEGDGSTIIFNILSIFESLLEMVPTLSKDLAERTKLLDYLKNVIRPDHGFTSSKQYSAEILAMIAQNDPSSQKLIFDNKGVELLLEAVGRTRKEDAKSEDEREMIYDLYNVILSCLFVEDNKKLFFDAEGLELMMILIKKRKWLRVSSLKLMDYAISEQERGCKHLVDIGGLGLVFAILMNADGKDAQKLEEHALSIIAQLLRMLRGERRTRTLWKLKENSFEKLWRIVNIFAQAYERANSVAEEEYVTRLEKGLYRSQVSARIISAAASDFGREVLEEMFKEFEHCNLSAVAAVLKEELQNVDSEAEDGEAVKNFLEELLQVYEA